MNFKEITNEIEQVMKEFQIGEMIHDEKFNLLEVMSAIEVLDKKMDINFESKRVPSFKERIDKGLIPLKLEMKEISMIMDELLCCMMSWFEGYTLVQSIQTCLLMHDIQKIENPYLLLFCKVFIFIIEEIKKVSFNREIREEEEFYPYSFDLEFPMIKDEFKFEVNRDEFEKEEDYLLIKNRIEFLKNFYKIHKILLSNNYQGLEKYLKEILIIMSLLEKDHIQEGDILLKIFDYEYCKRVNSNTPLREKKLLTFSETMIRFKKYMNDLFHFIHFQQLSNYENMLTFFMKISNLNINIVIRMMVMNSFFQNNKIFNKIEIIDISRKYLLNIPSITKKHIEILKNYQNIVDLPQYLSNYSRILILLLYSLMNNKGRTRRRISNLFKDLYSLEVKSEIIDLSLNKEKKEDKFILTLSVIDLTLFLMKLYLELGFELDLYQTIEYPYIYWYLEIIHGNKLQKLQKLKKENNELEYYLYKSIHKMLLIFIHQFNYSHQNGSIQILYENRLSPFFYLQQPPPYQFDIYQKATDTSKFSKDSLIKNAKDILEKTKKLLLNDTKNDHYLKIINSNIISLNLIEKMLLSRNVKIQFDFSLDKKIPIIKPK